MQKIRRAVPALRDLRPYDPKYLPARVYLNANESPYGLPEPVFEEIDGSLHRQSLHRYPDPLAKSLRTMIAEVLCLHEERVMIGNGGDELIFNLMLAYGGSDRKLLITPPSFSSYEIDARLTNTDTVKIDRLLNSVGSCTDCSGEKRNNTDLEYTVDKEAVLRRVSQGDIDMVMLASPNNPTGDALGEGFVSALLEASDAVILIDQAYVEFADASFDMKHLIGTYKNLAILRTFSKAYALAGVRLGYLLADEELIAELCKVRQPYSVNSFSAYAGLVAVKNRGSFVPQITETVNERRRMIKALREIPGISVFESEANFVLIRVANAMRIWQELYDGKGILLRDFSTSAGLAGCLRISIGKPEENDELLESLRNIVREDS